MMAIPKINTPIYDLKYIDDTKQLPPPNHLLETSLLLIINILIVTSNIELRILNKIFK